MRRPLACGLALAAALPLAACGGGGDLMAGRAPTLGEICELAGLSAPVETPEAQQDRSLDIFPRADSLILSTLHGETDNDVFPAFRHPTACSGARCNRDRSAERRRLCDRPRQHPAHAQRRHRRRLEARHHPRVGILGAYGCGGCQYRRLAGAQLVRDPERKPDRRGGHGRCPVRDRRRRSRRVPSGTHSRDRDLVRHHGGNARQRGRPGRAAGGRRGPDPTNFPAGGDGSGHTLDAAFGGIRNIDRGTAHPVETVLFENVAVDPDGTFARGQSGGRIQGGLYGPGHAEVAGVFEQSGITGAFGAKRQ